MTPNERHQLATILRSARYELGLSVREVATRAGVDMGTVSLIERCKIAQPRLDTIRAIAEVVGVQMVDIYAAVHWLQADELPSLRPYMRSKYDGLPDEALAEVEREIARITKAHGFGPRHNEDEAPDNEPNITEGRTS